jgi:hypothetical protein
MLYEIRNVIQEEDEPFCRWYSDKDFDLYVWFNQDDTIHSFQLCYDKDKSERALTWLAEGNKYRHEKVETGDERPKSRSTPILSPGGVFYKRPVAETFKEHSAELDAVLAGFIYEKIMGY